MCEFPVVMINYLIHVLVKLRIKISRDVAPNSKCSRSLTFEYHKYYIITSIRHKLAFYIAVAII